MKPPNLALVVISGRRLRSLKIDSDVIFFLEKPSQSSHIRDDHAAVAQTNQKGDMTGDKFEDHLRR
jgi:hypothetical protein